MFFSFNCNTPIIGMDYSYSDEQRKKVSVCFKSMHSMIVEPSFLELLSMMNGLFCKQDIINYATNVHLYEKQYITEVFDKMHSWGVVNEKNNRSLWGMPFDKTFSTDCFKSFNVRFLSASPALIDLSLLLCKYCFESISFVDPDIRVTQEDVIGSALLQKTDLDNPVNDLINLRQKRYSTQSDNWLTETDVKTIFICDGFSSNLADSNDIIMDANDYRKKITLCKDFAFLSVKNSGHEDTSLSEFEHMLLMESDVVFGVVDGFYS